MRLRGKVHCLSEAHGKALSNRPTQEVALLVAGLVPSTDIGEL